MTPNTIARIVTGAVLAVVAITAGVAVAHASGDQTPAAISAPVTHPDYDATIGMDVVQAGQYVGAYGYAVVETTDVSGIEPSCGEQPTGLIAFETSAGRVTAHTVVEELAVRAC